jgi:hypothetical protein
VTALQPNLAEVSNKTHFQTNAVTQHRAQKTLDFANLMIEVKDTRLNTSPRAISTGVSTSDQTRPPRSA